MRIKGFIVCAYSIWLTIDGKLFNRMSSCALLFKTGSFYITDLLNFNAVIDTVLQYLPIIHLLCFIHILMLLWL